MQFIYVDPQDRVHLFTPSDAPLFSLTQIAEALGYSRAKAARLKPSCHPRHIDRVLIHEGKYGHPAKVVDRYGLFLATPKSDTPHADHFHRWARAVMLATIDNPDDAAQIAMDYLLLEQVNLRATHEAQERALLGRLDAAQRALATFKPDYDPIPCLTPSKPVVAPVVVLYPDIDPGYFLKVDPTDEAKADKAAQEAYKALKAQRGA